jgi:hypothetical protein
MKISVETAARIIEGFIYQFARGRLVIASELTPGERTEVVAFLEAVQIDVIPPIGASE